MLIDCEIDYSYDLHNLAEDSVDFDIFIGRISKFAKELEIEGETKMRLKDFYESVEFLNLLF